MSTTNPTDLLNQDNDFDGEVPEPKQNFENIPDGTYQVVVDKVELTATKNTNLPMLAWTFKVLGPHHQGRLVWKYTVIKKDNLKWLKTDFFRCGLTDIKPSTLEANLHRFLDLKLEVRVQYKDKSEMPNVYINELLDENAVPAAAGPKVGGF